MRDGLLVVAGILLRLVGQVDDVGLDETFDRADVTLDLSLLGLWDLGQQVKNGVD